MSTRSGLLPSTVAQLRLNLNGNAVSGLQIVYGPGVNRMILETRLVC